MVTLTLKKKPSPSNEQAPTGTRPPLRSSGLRKRPTLAEAQARRAEQETEEQSPYPRAARPEFDRRPDERYRSEPPHQGGRREARDPRDVPDRRDPRDPRAPRDQRDPRAPQDLRHSRPPQPNRDRWPGERPPPHDTRPRQEPARGPGRPQDRFQERPPQRLQDRPPQRPAPQYQEAPRPRGPGPRSVVNPVVARQLSQAARSEPARPQPQPLGVPAADGERLSKRMTALGLASRREADEWIEAGWVRVNGRLAVLGQRVHRDDQIQVDPAAHRQQAQRMTILLNKPIGYVSGQAEDGYEPASVLIRPENQWKEDKSGHQWHPGHLRGLAPAGRLDIDSVGLLVLTQDGRVARQLIGDDSMVEKEYLVRVEYCRPGEQLPDADLALLNHGLSLDGQPLRPCKVSWANEDQLRFVLREGKKRQIRRMCETVGLKVVGLKRVRIGSVPLGHLPVGQWRYLRRDEYFA